MNDARPHPPQARRRAAALLGICLLLAFVLSADAAHGVLQALVTGAAPWIEGHPVLGPVAFVLVSGLSAMLAFFSAAVLVPAAVFSWGPWATIALLWLGWFLGGMAAFLLARRLGRPLVRSLASERAAAFYRQRLDADVGFLPVLLLQLALPSEVPGYLCGLMRVRLRVYLAALALAELPFAVGTVLLGESLVRRAPAGLLSLGLAGAGLMLFAAWLLRRRLRPPPGGPPGN